MIRMEKLLGMLEESGLKYFTNKEEKILLPFENHGQVIVSLEENGEFIRFHYSEAERLRSSESHFGELLSFCAYLTGVVKGVKVMFDEEDGEVSTSIELPIEDASFTSNQLKSAVVRLVETTKRLKKGCRFIRKHGKSPTLEQLQDETEDEISQSIPGIH